MRNYFIPKDLHIMRNILMTEGLSSETAFFSRQDKEKILSEHLIEEFEKIYPIFEEYHIPKGFDSVIDEITMIIEERWKEYKSSHIKYTDLEKSIEKYKYDVSREKKPIELSGYVYDSREKACKKKEEFNNKYEFPILIYFYDTYGEISIENTLAGKNENKRRIAKFNVYLESIKNTTSIKQIVRHEFLHIVERFSNRGEDLSFMKKMRETKLEMFNELKEKYPIDQVLTCINIFLLFSDTECHARINELSERIKRADSETIKRVSGEDHSIKIRGILNIFKYCLKTTLYTEMKAFVDDIDKAISNPIHEIPEYIKCFIEFNYEKNIFKYSNIRPSSSTYLSILEKMAFYFDKKCKEFETDCYKIIYKTLEERGLYDEESNFERYISGDALKEMLVFNSQEIFYLFNIDNDFH